MAHHKRHGTKRWNRACAMCKAEKQMRSASGYRVLLRNAARAREALREAA